MAKVRERSAGAVVVHDGDGRREYLLLRYGAGQWGFPKGHIEAGEDEAQAAHREVEEETGIPEELQFKVEGFRDSTEYKFRRGKTLVEKDVVFYLIQAKSRDVKLSPEHTDYVWLPFKDAYQRLAFEGPRRILQSAEEFLAKAAAEARTAKGTPGGTAT